MEMYPFTDEQLRDYIKSQYEDITDEQLDEIIAAFHKLVDYITVFQATPPHPTTGTELTPTREIVNFHQATEPSTSNHGLF